MNFQIKNQGNKLSIHAKPPLFQIWIYPENIIPSLWKQQHEFSELLRTNFNLNAKLEAGI
jgi:hypothetical protein